MIAKYILAVVAITFVALGLARLVRGDDRYRPQGCIWFLISVIFGLVSAWLLYRGDL